MSLNFFSKLERRENTEEEVYAVLCPLFKLSRKWSFANLRVYIWWQKCWAERGQNVSPILTVLSSVKFWKKWELGFEIKRNDFETGISGPLEGNNRCLTIHFPPSMPYHWLFLNFENIKAMAKEYALKRLSWGLQHQLMSSYDLRITSCSQTAAILDAPLWISWFSKNTKLIVQLLTRDWNKLF